jgi:hypothetical protein
MLAALVMAAATAAAAVAAAVRLLDSSLPFASALVNHPDSSTRWTHLRRAAVGRVKDFDDVAQQLVIERNHPLHMPLCDIQQCGGRELTSTQQREHTWQVHKGIGRTRGQSSLLGRGFGQSSPLARPLRRWCPRLRLLTQDRRCVSPAVCDFGNMALARAARLDDKQDGQPMGLGDIPCLSRDVAEVYVRIVLRESLGVFPDEVVHCEER